MTKFAGRKARPAAGRSAAGHGADGRAGAKRSEGGRSEGGWSDAARTGSPRAGDLRAGDLRAGVGRPHFTGRAAVLAVVLCAVALSLAYPVRDYLAQRRQIDMLLAQRQQIGQHLRRLEREQAMLKSPAFIEEVARDQLHMCLPTQMCYVIIDPAARSGTSVAARQAATPWYGRLWSSVQQADAQPAAKRQGKAGRG